MLYLLIALLVWCSTALACLAPYTVKHLTQTVRTGQCGVGKQEAVGMQGRCTHSWQRFKKCLNSRPGRERKSLSRCCRSCARPARTHMAVEILGGKAAAAAGLLVDLLQMSCQLLFVVRNAGNVKQLDVKHHGAGRRNARPARGCGRQGRNEGRIQVECRPQNAELEGGSPEAGVARAPGEVRAGVGCVAGGARAALNPHPSGPSAPAGRPLGKARSPGM